MQRIIDFSAIDDPRMEQKQLDVALAKLYGNGIIPVTKLSPAGVYNLLLSVKTYLKEIRILTAIDNPDVLDELLTAAAAANVCDMARTMDEATLLRVARWAKKEDALPDAQFEVKLRKKARARGVSVEAVAVAQLSQLLELQLQGRLSVRCEAKIVKLQSKIDRERRKLASLDEADAHNKPPTKKKRMADK